MKALKEIMNLIFVDIFRQAILRPSRFEVFFGYISYYFYFNCLRVCLHLFFFFFYRLYLSACTLDLHTVFNAICKTCKSLIAPTFFSACIFPFLFFPHTKNKKTWLGSNFVVTSYSSLSINQIGGGVCWGGPRILNQWGRNIKRKKTLNKHLYSIKK